MHLRGRTLATSVIAVLETTSSNSGFSGHFSSFHFLDISPLCPDKIAFDWANCLISYKINI